jgi:hypothetical protein
LAAGAATSAAVAPGDGNSHNKPHQHQPTESLLTAGEHWHAPLVFASRHTQRLGQRCTATYASPRHPRRGSQTRLIPCQRAKAALRKQSRSKIQWLLIICTCRFLGRCNVSIHVTFFRFKLEPARACPKPCLICLRLAQGLVARLAVCVAYAMCQGTAPQGSAPMTLGDSPPAAGQGRRCQCPSRTQRHATSSIPRQGTLTDTSARLLVAWY